MSGVLKFSLENEKVKRERRIFITENPDLNKLVLKLENTSSDTITLKPDSIISLGLENLVDPKDVALVTSEGWKISYENNSLIFRPENVFLLKKSDSLEISFSFKVSPLPNNKGLHTDMCVGYMNIEGIEENNVFLPEIFFQIYDALGSPQLEVQWKVPPEYREVAQIREGNEVFISNEKNKWLNKLQFSIINKTSTLDNGKIFKSPLNTSGGSVEGSFFKVSFLFIDDEKLDNTKQEIGKEVLTTRTLLEKIVIELGNSTNSWEKKDQFSIKPRDKEILNAGGSVDISISNIITSLPNEFTTLMFIEYSLPGYTEGYLSLPIVKLIPKPSIIDFIVNSPEVIKSSDEIKLSWKTFAADFIKLSFIENNKSNKFFAPPVEEFQKDNYLNKIIQTSKNEQAEGRLLTEEFIFSHKQEKDSTYVLSVLDSNNNISDQKTFNIDVTLPVLEIVSFSANDYFFNEDTLTNPIQLTWEVRNASSIEIFKDEISSKNRIYYKEHNELNHSEEVTDVGENYLKIQIKSGTFFILKAIPLIESDVPVDEVLPEETRKIKITVYKLGSIPIPLQPTYCSKLKNIALSTSGNYLYLLGADQVYQEGYLNVFDTSTFKSSETSILPALYELPTDIEENPTVPPEIPADSYKFLFHLAVNYDWNNNITSFIKDGKEKVLCSRTEQLTYIDVESKNYENNTHLELELSKNKTWNNKNFQARQLDESAFICKNVSLDNKLYYLGQKSKNIHYLDLEKNINYLDAIKTDFEGEGDLIAATLKYFSEENLLYYALSDSYHENSQKSLFKVYNFNTKTSANIKIPDDEIVWDIGISEMPEAWDLGISDLKSKIYYIYYLTTKKNDRNNFPFLYIIDSITFKERHKIKFQNGYTTFYPDSYSGEPLLKLEISKDGKIVYLNISGSLYILKHF